MGHGSTAYFSARYNVYKYRVPGNNWTKLPQCKYRFFSMAIVNYTLTTIGGRVRGGGNTNTLLSLSGSSWEEVLPPMPTKREFPAIASTPTRLVVAGGTRSLVRENMTTVEVLNTETLQWSTVSSLPQKAFSHQMTTCDGCIYLASSNSKVFSCSMEDLLKSTNSSDGVWTRLASIPTSEWSSLTALSGRVLAIGGEDGRFSANPIGDIYCYDMASNSWSVIGEIPTPIVEALTAILPSNELVVVGGNATEIGSCE